MTFHDCGFYCMGQDPTSNFRQPECVDSELEFEQWQSGGAGRRKTCGTGGCSASALAKDHRPGLGDVLSRSRPPKILGTQVQIDKIICESSASTCPAASPSNSASMHTSTNTAPQTDPPPPPMLIPTLVREPLTNFNNAFVSRDKSVPWGIDRIHAMATWE